MKYITNNENEFDNPIALHLSAFDKQVG
jgi:hypothetical protein